MKRAVHQFHQGIRSRDAIGDEMLAIRQTLRAAGYDSEIFVEQMPSGSGLGARSLREYRGSPESVLLVHHSIGHDSAGIVAALPDRKFLVYHNITPVRYLEGIPTMQRFAELGRSQLLIYRDRMEGAFADSSYNAAELLELGYPPAQTLPPTFALGRLGPASKQGTAPETTPLVLFVGRVAANKKQDHVVEAFDRFAARRPQARLALVGEGSRADPYVLSFLERIAASPHRDRIAWIECATDEDLAALYDQASLYLSMSEHEGFGLPLLEAFSRDVPVLAYRAAAVPETLGGAGVLFTEKRMDEIAAMMVELTADGPFRRRIVEDQRQRLAEPEIARVRERLLVAMEQIFSRRAPAARRRPAPALEIRIEGPFENSYGLAVANRALGEALERHTAHRVSFYATEGPGDYLPRSRDLSDKPLAAELWSRSFSAGAPDVLIRNTYPPRFDHLRGQLNLSFFFWEDSLIPADWAARFNASYDGVLAPTRYVETVLRASGVTIPIAVVPTPVSLPEGFQEPPAAGLAKPGSVRFLSVGSAFPRKGVDVLLRAFGSAFTSRDDVVLVLKTFPNIHNRVAEMLAEMRADKPAFPAVVHIDRDVTPAELLALYRGADALVHPSRAEGFGLPVVEAMLLGIPVIATSATGLADFCDEQTALVIPHRMSPSRSHLAVPGAEWAEPDPRALADLLRGFASGVLREEAARRAENARRRATETFSPPAAARAAARAIEGLHDARTKRTSVAYVSTWNSRCGIAAYTENLSRALPAGSVDVHVFANSDSQTLRPDSRNVSRVWHQAAGDYDGLVNAALELDPDVVHVQFHPGLFAEYRRLGDALRELDERGLRILATLHLIEDVNFHGRKMTVDLLRRALGHCDLLLAHREDDLHRLSDGSSGPDQTVIGMAGEVFPPRRPESVRRELGLAGRRILASFGFAFPHKGILEAIVATGLLRERFPEVLFLALSAVRPEAESQLYLARCRDRVAELDLEDHVWLIPDYLSDAELALLLSCAEVVVLPYLATKESASAAVRYPLAAGRPTITTRGRIFDDVAEAVIRIPGPDPRRLAARIASLFADPRKQARHARAARRFARKHSWTRVARRHARLYGELALSRRPPPDPHGAR